MSPSLDGRDLHPTGVWETQVTPIAADGEITRLVAISRDISDRIEYREELERQNDRLEEFASIVSHDLRNPLSVLEGSLTLAETPATTSSSTAVTVQRPHEGTHRGSADSRP